MARYAIIALAALSTLATATHAGFIITIEPDGNGNVVATGSGTINTTALTPFSQPALGDAFVRGTNGFIGIAPLPSDSTYLSGYYGGVSGPSDFGPASTAYTASSTSGD